MKRSGAGSAMERLQEITSMLNLAIPNRRYPPSPLRPAELTLVPSHGLELRGPFSGVARVARRQTRSAVQRSPLSAPLCRCCYLRPVKATETGLLNQGRPRIRDVDSLQMYVLKRNRVRSSNPSIRSLGASALAGRPSKRISGQEAQSLTNSSAAGSSACNKNGDHLAGRSASAYRDCHAKTANATAVEFIACQMRTR